jgi:predicted aspartyl protease
MTIPLIEYHFKEDIHQYLIQLDINGHKALALIDTGASATVLSREYADKLGLELKAHEESGQSASGNLEIMIANINVSIADKTFEDMPVAVIDMSHFKSIYEEDGFEIIDAILGADVLKKINASLDFSTFEIQWDIKSSEIKDVPVVIHPILQDDYGDGQYVFFVEVILAGLPVFALLDTGATGCILNETIATDLKLDIVEGIGEGQSASGPVKRRRIKVDIGIAGKTIPAYKAGVINFSDAKKSLEAKGLKSYDFIIGMNLLLHLRATIDLDKLVLRIPE